MGSWTIARLLMHRVCAIKQGDFVSMLATWVIGLSLMNPALAADTADSGAIPLDTAFADSGDTGDTDDTDDLRVDTGPTPSPYKGAAEWAGDTGGSPEFCACSGASPAGGLLTGSLVLALLAARRLDD
jgi:hypothetical protein